MQKLLTMTTLLTLTTTLLTTAPLNKYCLSYDFSQCTACVQSLPSKTVQCAPIKAPMAHCIIYNTETECDMCQLNYKPSKDKNSCEKIEEKNCVYFDPKKNICSICKLGMKIVDGICEEENKCEMENCLLCGSEKNVEQCYMCREGFVVGVESPFRNLRFVCREERQGTKGCGIYYPLTSVCWGCDLGYYMDPISRECLWSDAYHIDKFGN